jgi:GAF domain-containing protein
VPTPDHLAELRWSACRSLRRSLAADRVVSICVRGGSDEQDLSVVVDTGEEDVPSVTVLPLSAFSEERRAAFRSGQPVVVADAAAIDRTNGDDDGEAQHRSLSVAAYVAVPVLCDGAWVATMGVHQHTPRAWTGEEVDRIRAAAEETWAALETAGWSYR